MSLPVRSPRFLTTALAPAWWPRAATLLLGATAVGMLLMAVYLALRVASTVTAEVSIAAGVVAGLLLAAEVFVGVHALGYCASVMKATRHPLGSSIPMFAPFAAVPVAVLVTTFNESEEVIEETLASVRAMDYPTFRIYLLDDSTCEASRLAASRLAERYGARLVHRTDRAGYKAGAINDLLPALDEPYVAVLDADQRPAHSWLREIVPVLEANPRLAMVQAPQIYVDTGGMPVAEAARHQQAVFYEHICEGKCVSNAMFCCGSNVVLRRDALLSIEVDDNGRRNFFDETSVTEDFASSVRLHEGGWQSAYVNRTYVVGMAPETLAAYFTQQTRWAMGTVGVFLRLARRLFSHPRVLRPAQWWEYLLSGSYYFVGFANFIFMCASISFLLFGVLAVRMDARLYVALFVPYFMVTMGIFFLGMKLRNHAVRGVWLGTVLTFGTFWVFMQAATIALLGIKRGFGVTPKAVGGRLPFSALKPQIIMLALCSAAAAAGVLRLARAGVDLPYVVTTFWAMYHATLLGALLFHFNRPVTIRPRVPMFERLTVRS